MKRSYQTVTELTLAIKKQYIFQLSNDETVIFFMNEKQLYHYVANHQELYTKAMKQLYATKNYEQLEKILCLMNCFFHHQDYISVKKDLLSKLLHYPLTLQHYCIIRHLIDFENIPLSKIVETLYHYGMSQEECAKVCLLEDNESLACDYLKQLDCCQNENILRLLCSLSLYEYLSLMSDYRRKEKNYQLMVQ
jgi:hypothetical protein